MGQLYQVLASGLNIRSAPVNGAVLSVLPRGHVVETTGAAAPAGWLEVKTDNHGSQLTGYVSAAHVMPVDAAPGTDPAHDGQLNVTEAKLKSLTPNGRNFILQGLAASFDAMAPAYVINTAQRICHFFAQAAHETDGFRTLEEYGGPTYWSRYDGRTDLGNTNPGDGARYHGRGIFQLTGRANYRRIGAKVGLELETNPDLAAQPANSLKIAFEYWKSRDINTPADADDIREVTRRINGGFNGLEERRQFFTKARTIWV